MILTEETEVLGEKHYTAWVVDEWMSREHWWNGTDRGNWGTGRKTLYSVGGRWVNEYGALVEWYWQGKLRCWEKNIIERGWFMNEWVWSIGVMILTGETEVLGEKHYRAWVVDEWMSREHWLNGTDRGNWGTGRKTLYSVGDRWVNEYGALVEWYWQGKLKCWEKNIIERGWLMNEWVWSIGGMVLTGETEVLGEKHYRAWVVDGWMSTEHLWNDTDRRNWGTERKTLYSVGGWWMNEYGTLVEWYWQGKLKCWEKNIIERGW